MFDHTVNIRPVELKDAVDLRENCFSMNTLEEVQDRIRHNIEQVGEGKGIQLVAEVDGQVIGTAQLIRQTMPLFAHRAEVGALVIHPNYQGQGIARRLVEECRKQAVGMGIKILEISCRGNEPVEKIYPRFGFTEYGRLPGGIVEPWGEHKTYDIVYFYQLL